MTLAKQIEAARDIIREKILNAVFWMRHDGVCNEAYYQGKRDAFDECQNIFLSTLPARPMTEDELFNGVMELWCANKMDKKNKSDEDVVKYTIRALRDAGVLYCAEEGE